MNKSISEEELQNIWNKMVETDPLNATPAEYMIEIVREMNKKGE